MITCDECRKPYAGPAYYGLDRGACAEGADDPGHAAICTGNLCPVCAGPFLIPDRPDDQRRPVAPDAAGEATMRAMIADALRP